jgi:hypothetical protein
LNLPPLKGFFRKLCRIAQKRNFLLASLHEGLY